MAPATVSVDAISWGPSMDTVFCTPPASSWGRTDPRDRRSEWRGQVNVAASALPLPETKGGAGSA